MGCTSRGCISMGYKPFRCFPAALGRWAVSPPHSAAPGTLVLPLSLPMFWALLYSVMWALLSPPPCTRHTGAGSPASPLATWAWATLLCTTVPCHAALPPHNSAVLLHPALWGWAGSRSQREGQPEPLTAAAAKMIWVAVAGWELEATNSPLPGCRWADCWTALTYRIKLQSHIQMLPN